MLILDLPGDILQLIFEYLSHSDLKSLRQVNRLLRSLHRTYFALLAPETYTSRHRLHRETNLKIVAKLPGTYLHLDAINFYNNSLLISYRDQPRNQNVLVYSLAENRVQDDWRGFGTVDAIYEDQMIVRKEYAKDYTQESVWLHYGEERKLLSKNISFEHNFKIWKNYMTIIPNYDTASCRIINLDTGEQSQLTLPSLVYLKRQRDEFSFFCINGFLDRRHCCYYDIRSRRFNCFWSCNDSYIGEILQVDENYVAYNERPQKHCIRLLDLRKPNEAVKTFEYAKLEYTPVSLAYVIDARYLYTDMGEVSCIDLLKGEIIKKWECEDNPYKLEVKSGYLVDSFFDTWIEKKELTLARFE